MKLCSSLFYLALISTAVGMKLHVELAVEASKEEAKPACEDGEVGGGHSCSSSWIKGACSSTVSTGGRSFKVSDVCPKTCGTCPTETAPTGGGSGGSCGAYSHYKFTPTMTGYAEDLRRGGGMQLSELELRSQGKAVDMSAAKVTQPGGRIATSSEGCNKVADGSVNSKVCCDVIPITFEFDSPVQVDAFRLATANDHYGRDPLQWKWEGSNDGQSWTVTQSQDTSYSVPVSRRTYSDEIAWSQPACADDADGDADGDGDGDADDDGAKMDQVKERAARKENRPRGERNNDRKQKRQDAKANRDNARNDRKDQRAERDKKESDRNAERDDVQAARAQRQAAKGA